MIDFLAQLHFQRPLWLLCIPALIAFAVYARSRPLIAGDWNKHIDAHLLSYLSLEESQHSGRFGINQIRVMGWISLIIASIALAGPAWNKVDQPPLKNTARTFIIADMTMSMYASDIQPSRLVRLKFKMRELLKAIPDGEFSLIAYSGDAHVVSPLTDDYRAIDNLIPALSPGIFPAIGSNPESAFQQLNQLLEGKARGFNRVIMFTDEILSASEQTILDSFPDNIDQFIVVGVGTDKGSPITLPSGRFMKDAKGNIVSAKLNRQKLSTFASKAGGSYLELSNDNSDIERISRQLSATASGQVSNLSLSTNVKNKARQVKMDQWNDRGGWFALAIIPFFLCLFRKGYLFVCLITIGTVSLQSPPTNAQNLDPDEASQPAVPANGSSYKNVPEKNSLWQRLWYNSDQLGARALENQQNELAIDSFNNQEWKSHAQTLNGNHKQAAELIDELIVNNSQPENRRAELIYNKGFNLAHAGDLQQASDTFAEALAINEDFSEAAKAKDIVDKLLEQSASESQDSNSDNSEQSDNKQQQSDQQEGNQGSGEQQQDQNSDEAQKHQEPSETSNSQQQNQEQQQAQKQNQHQNQNQNANQQPEEKLSDQQDKEPQQLSRQEQQQLAQQEENKQQGEQAPLSSFEQLSDAEQAELQSWLNQLTDDPGGLLRRKFDYERQVREREGSVIVDNENQQLW